jgi:hypothetical protein
MPYKDHIQRPKVKSRKPVHAPTTDLFENDLFPLKAREGSKAEHSGINPKSMNAHTILQLQRMIGNQAVMRLVQYTGAVNSVQRDGGGSALVVERPKPKAKVVAVTPEEAPRGGSGAPAPKAKEPEEELTEEGLKAEIAADKARAAIEDEALEAAIAALPDKQELSVEEELEQMEAELRASGELVDTPEDAELAALEAEYDKNPDMDLGDVSKLL